MLRYRKVTVQLQIFETDLCTAYKQQIWSNSQEMFTAAQHWTKHLASPKCCKMLSVYTRLRLIESFSSNFSTEKNVHACKMLVKCSHFVNRRYLWNLLNTWTSSILTDNKVTHYQMHPLWPPGADILLLPLYVLIWGWGRRGEATETVQHGGRINSGDRG